LAVRSVAEEAIARARTGRGPTLIEAKTYRMKPHCMVIRETRDQCELDEWAEKDPIRRFEAYLLGEGGLSSAELQAVRDDIELLLAAAAHFAEAGPWPDPSRVMDVLWA
jgi:pyruvate dehydrogenase E1 component alpha subunit